MVTCKYLTLYLSRSLVLQIYIACVTGVQRERRGSKRDRYDLGAIAPRSH